MSRNFPRLALLSAAIVSVVACESTKSANPLSPTVAGPIPGVNISPPKLLEPGSGWQLKADKQPLTLLLENASTNGVRPLSYVFEVATDAGFQKKTLSRSGVSQGSGGRTSLKLTSELPTGKTYYWRARAEDGANTGAFSAPVSFELLSPVWFDRPVPLSPVNGEPTDTTPTLRFRNAARSGPVGPLTYQVEVSRNGGFTAIAWSGRTGEQGGETSITASGLQASETFYWRTRITDPDHIGAWSVTARFVTSESPSDGGRRWWWWWWWWWIRRQLRVARRRLHRAVHLGQVSQLPAGRRLVVKAQGEHGIPARSDDRSGHLRRPRRRLESQTWRPGAQHRLRGRAERRYHRRP